MFGYPSRRGIFQNQYSNEKIPNLFNISKQVNYILLL